MSSILKALKKIEGRKVDTSLPAWPFGAGSPDSMDRHIHRSRRRQKILGLLIILCVVALAGKFYIGSRPEPEKTVPEKTVAQSPPPPTPALTVEPTEITPPETRKIVEETPESQPVAEPSPREASPDTASPSVTSPPPAEEAATEADAPEITPPPMAEPSETTAVEESPTATITETFSPPPADKAGLSLMALVWAEEPESRFVVINGTIVRQGGSIENSTVVRIEEDYVVMRTDGVTWKLH